MRQPQREFSIIGQEKQSLAGEIQTPHGIDDLPLLGQQFINRRAVVFILLGTHAAAGFVQSQVELALGADRLAVHRHLVVFRVNF